MAKESKRSTTLVEIKPELFEILDQEYNETRPKPVNFTSFVNEIISLYVKRGKLAKKKYPYLAFISADPTTGLYVKDHKRDVVAEIEMKLESKELLRCKLDKSTTCDHYMFALICSTIMRMLPDSFIQGNPESKLKELAIL